jgi:hypothetical protein
MCRIPIFFVFMIACRSTGRHRSHGMTDDQGDIRLITIRREESEAEVAGNSRLTQADDQLVAAHRTADIAAGDGVHYVVALVNHDRVVAGQQIVD